MIEFVNDTIQLLKGHKVPFLTKYNQAFEASSRLIVPARDFITDLMQLALRRTTSSSSLEQFKQIVVSWVSELIEDDSVDLKFAEILAVTIFARREELVRVLTELVFR